MNVKKGILSVILGMSAVGLFTKILTTFLIFGSYLSMKNEIVSSGYHI